jgi:hypothetical protein
VSTCAARRIRTAGHVIWRRQLQMVGPSKLRRNLDLASLSPVLGGVNRDGEAPEPAWAGKNRAGVEYRRPERSSRRTRLPASRTGRPSLRVPRPSRGDCLWFESGRVSILPGEAADKSGPPPRLHSCDEIESLRARESGSPSANLSLQKPEDTVHRRLLRIRARCYESNRSGPENCLSLRSIAGLYGQKPQATVRSRRLRSEWCS